MLKATTFAAAEPTAPRDADYGDPTRLVNRAYASLSR